MKHEVSVVELVDALVQNAILLGVSDIHLEPNQQHIRVRFRIDGILVEQPPIDRDVSDQVIARFKVLAQVDSTQKRMPQDGKFTFTGGTTPVDIRLSTFPSVWGEKLVIRILDVAHHLIGLESLGFSSADLVCVTQLVSRAHGFFLVTGPTGSGKTSTLYGILEYLHDPARNIVTLEDPVEYSLQGVTQSLIRADAGFTFADGIRSVLRQDPDVIMIGEIRDRETARTAIEAAMTGHMVLSTLHTTDAPGALVRLMDMGIEPYLINAALTGVLAQRLVRKLCTACKYLAAPTADEQTLLNKLGRNESQFYTAKGCEACNYIGYKGRVGIFEVLPITPEIRLAMVTHPHIDRLYAVAREQGMRTLLEDALDKLCAGTISLREVVRVIL